MNVSLSLTWYPVWRRNFLVWKKLAIPSLLGNLCCRRWTGCPT